MKSPPYSSSRRLFFAAAVLVCKQVLSITHAPYFEKLNILSRTNFVANTDNISGNLTYPYHIVTLSPNAPSYGGIGNLLLGMLGVGGIALASGRVEIMNHAVLQSMFAHPDAEHGRSFAILENELIASLEGQQRSDLTRGFHKLHPCGGIASHVSNRLVVVVVNCFDFNSNNSIVIILSSSSNTI